MSVCLYIHCEVLHIQNSMFSQLNAAGLSGIYPNGPRPASAPMDMDLRIYECVNDFKAAILSMYHVL